MLKLLKVMQKRFLAHNLHPVSVLSDYGLRRFRFSMKRVGWILVLLGSTYSLVGQASLVSEPVEQFARSAPAAAGPNTAAPLAVTFQMTAVSVQPVDYFSNAARVPATVESMSQVLQLAESKRRADSQGPVYLGNTDELRMKPRVTALPEPSVWVLLVTGLVALGLSRRRSRAS